MIDFHSHVLPEMDDGSRSVERSIEMLSAEREQGVDTVVATPHFYANDESVESFLKRREKAAEKLLREWNAPPRILLGAEVRYYPGISRLEGLKLLRVKGSDLLLLEMPFSRWTEYVIKEVEDLATSGSVTLVLAHVERYIAMQKRETLQRLLRSGVLFQCNASFFTQGLGRGRALRMMRDGEIHFLGSDCHNMTDRAPNMAFAINLLSKKFGEQFIADFAEFGSEMLTFYNEK